MKTRRAKFTICAMVFAPLIMTSCASFSSLINRKIDPTCLKIFNRPGTFSNFNHSNVWSNACVDINDNINTPLIYVTKYDGFSGGVFMDERDQIRRPGYQH